MVVVHLLGAASVEPSSLGILEPLFGELIRVQIFCIMSGFVIFMMMSRRREPYLPYLSRRFLRIYPVYIFAFVLSVAMSGIAYDALEAADFPGSKNADRIAIYEASFAMWPQHLLSHLTLLHGIVPNQWLPFGAYAFLGQGWNISTEFQFYVIAPVLFWVLHDARLTFKILMIAGIAAAWYVGMRWPNGAALSYFAIYFLTGIASFYAWRRSWKDRGLLNKWTIAAAAVAVGTASIAIGMWIFIFGSALYVRDRAGNSMPGYGWIFPVGDGQINVGIGLLSTFRDFKSVNTTHIMNEFAATAPEYWGISPETATSVPTGGRLPMGGSIEPKCGPTWLVVGDAGGSINPFNGEGIDYAYETGRMAAELIDEALETASAMPLARYPDLLEAEYGLYFRVARAFAHVIGQPELMQQLTRVGMQSRTLMEWVLRIMANLLRPDEVGPAELAYKAAATLVRLAPDN